MSDPQFKISVLGISSFYIYLHLDSDIPDTRETDLYIGLPIISINICILHNNHCQSWKSLITPNTQMIIGIYLFITLYYFTIESILLTTLIGIKYYKKSLTTSGPKHTCTIIVTAEVMKYNTPLTNGYRDKSDKKL